MPPCGVDYVCFTDQPFDRVPKPWVALPLEKISADPNRNAKRYKALPHYLFASEADTIWVDANFRITRGFDELLPLLDEHPVVLFKHFERHCLYDEACVCKAMGLDDPETIDRQMDRYRLDGFPAQYGLPECGTILRRDTLPERRLMERWWYEIQNGSRRDQLSFMYAVWITGSRGLVKILDRTAREGVYHTWTPHLCMGPLQ